MVRGSLRTRAPRATFGALVAIALVVAAMSTTVGFAATSVKPYSVRFTPVSVAGGSSTTFSATITNLSDNQVLGSANVTAPAGVAVAPTNIAVTPASSTTTATLAGNVIQLRSLEIAPAASKTLTFVAAVPCSASTSAWRVDAKQSNNFNGPPGNVFVLDGAASSLQLTVVGSCHLNFFTQPADAVKNTAISTTPLNMPPGGAIAVEVLDGNNQRVTASTVPITVALSPASGVLSGTTVRNAAMGVASFADLSVSQHGQYALSASSPGMLGATSGSFLIWDQATSCTSGSTCSVTVAAPKSVTSQITSNASSGALVASLGADTIDCGDPYNHAPSTTTFNAYGSAASGTKTATMQIDKAVVQAQPNNGAAFYRVCYESPTPFRDRTGVTVTLGLLPDCNTVANVAPCVASVSKTQAGDVREVLRLPAGDPRFR
jgi:hypothetical protein